MSRPSKPTFDPLRPLKVRRPFTGGGRHFALGDHFDWRRLKIERFRVERLFNAGFLLHSSEEEEAEETSDQEETSSTENVEAGSETVNSENDGLDAIDGMAELREIAKAEGAPLKISKDDQRKAIRAHRAERSS